MRIANLTLACLVALTSLGAALAATLHAQSSCEMAPWSERVDLLRFVGDSFALRPTDVAVGAGRLVMLSEFPDSFGDRRYRFPDGYHVGMEVDTRTLQSQVLRFTWTRGSFADPRVGVDGDGTARALWHEAAGVSIDDSTGGRGMTQLWSGIVRNGEIEAPRLLLWGAELKRPSRVVPDGRGELHAVVAQWQSSSRPLLMHLTTDSKGWRVDTIPQAGIVPRISPDLRVVGDTLHLVYISAEESHEPSAPRDYNSVWYMRSNDRGLTWLRRVRVQLSGMRPANAPLIDVASTGVIVIAWRQEFLAERDRGDVITGARSRDGGLTWSPLPVIPKLEAPRDVASIWTDRCGRTLLHLEEGGLGESMRASTVALDENGWSELDPLETPHRNIGRTIITQDAQGQLFRLFPSVTWVPGTLAEVFLHLTRQRPVVPR